MFREYSGMCKGIKWSIQECLGKGLKGVFKMLFHDFLSLLFGSLKFRLQSLYYTFNYCKLTKKLCYLFYHFCNYLFWPFSLYTAVWIGYCTAGIWIRREKIFLPFSVSTSSSSSTAAVPVQCTVCSKCTVIGYSRTWFQCVQDVCTVYRL